MRKELKEKLPRMITVDEMNKSLYILRQLLDTILVEGKEEDTEVWEAMFMNGLYPYAYSTQEFDEARNYCFYVLKEYEEKHGEDEKFILTRNVINAATANAAIRRVFYNPYGGYGQYDREYILSLVKDDVEGEE